MCQKAKVLSARNALALLALASTLAFLAGCVAPFSDLQSAKLLGKGNFEVTPSYSSVTVTDSDAGTTEHIQDHFGAQIGFGLANFMDFRLRYEHISATVDTESVSANVIGFGPKFRLMKDWLAFYVPIGFAFGGDVDESSQTWQVHPTLLGTLSIGKSFELNPSAKIMIPFDSDIETLYAFNLGAAISTDVRKWSLRPEIGISTNFQGGHFMHISVGLTLGSALFKK
jgi:hypothetical protein